MATVRKPLNISDIAKGAADVTGDGIVSTADFLALRKHCNGANSIY